MYAIPHGDGSLGVQVEQGEYYRSFRDAWCED
jgi:hypothetical protein